jgi:hypothetical protein
MSQKTVKKNASLILGEVPFEKRFFCCDGQVFSTIEQLKNSIPGMSKEVFEFHVNSQKNDFCNWIDLVVRDPVLAKTISKEKSKDNFVKAIDKRIKELKNISKK